MTDLFAYRVIPVAVVEDAATAEPLGQALVAGGLPVAEVTLRTEAAVEAIAVMSRIDGLLVGAATVVSVDQVDQAISAGARFIVSPGLRADVVRRAQEAQIPVVPGAVTPSEIMQARALSLDTVKFFPASVYGGPSAIRALAAPFVGMTFIPTGGVGPQNLGDYLSLPCVPAVGGSWMVPSHLIAAGAYDQISGLCAEAVAAAAAC